MEYIAQQEDPEGYARFLQDVSQYDAESETIQGSDIFDKFRSDLLSAVQQEYPNANIQQTDVDFYEMDYEENSAVYKYTNASMTDARRRMLLNLGHTFHSIGDFAKKTTHNVGKFAKKATSGVRNFVKKDGPKIAKYGAIAALSGIDIAAKGPKGGLSDAAKSFKSGNVLTAAELAAKDVITHRYP